MKKVLKITSALLLVSTLLIGCEDLSEAQNEQFTKIIEENSENLEINSDGSEDEIVISYQDVIDTEPEILEDANIDVAIDMLEEKSGHWVNHLVLSRLPGNVYEALKTGEAEIVLGAWENKWVEYPEEQIARNDYQLIKFAAPKHYMFYFDSILEKHEYWEKLHDFSDCLAAGSYYAKITYGEEVYKGYFTLSFPTVVQDYVDSITTFEGIKVDSSNVAGFAAILEASLDKTSTHNKVTLCGELTNAELKSVVTVIKQNAKYIDDLDLYNLNVEGLGDNNSSNSSYTLSYSTNLRKITLPKTLKYLGPNFLSHCENLEEIELNDGLEIMSYSCIAYCNNLKKIIIPDSVKLIGQACFFQCKNIEEIVFSENSQLEKIGAGFVRYGKLKTMLIPRGVTVLAPWQLSDYSTISSSTGFGVFNENRQLESVTMYNTMTLIHKNAFRECTNLNTIYFHGTPEEWKKIENNSTEAKKATIVYLED